MNIKSGQKLNSAAMFGCNGVMKRSPSQMALDELFNPTRNSEIEDGINPNNDQKSASDEDGEIFALQTNFSRLPFTNPSGTGNNFLRFNAPNDAPLWSQNLISKHPCHSGTIDSQSSICIGSPTSVTNPKSRKNQTATFATSGSSREQSDDDDLEIEIGQCEQSNDSIELKRFKRMVSNRESARRSRRRKQAHLADLEQQVDQLRGENASLFKQLANATQQFKDATTNNRVLKSDVEALRAKVKLAEDMVTRGSLTSSLSHLLQNYLNTQSLSNTNMCSVENVSPTITIRGDDPTGPYPLLGVSGQSAAVGLEIVENLNTNLKNGVSDDAVSCISDMWTWDSHAASVTK